MGDRESFDAVRSRQIDADNAWAKAHIEKAENWLDDQADRQRALIPPNDHVGLLMHDGTLGIVKTAYHLAKGLLGLAMDVGRLKDDPVYRENVAQKVWNGAVWLAKEARISQGSQGIEGIQDQNERVIAFSKGLWDKAKKGWKEAGTKPGHQTQLVVEIAANIALFFVGGEAATAARAEKLEEGAAILEEVTQPCKTIIMSNKEILAEQALKDAAAAERAAEAAKATKAAEEAADAAKAAEMRAPKEPSAPKPVEPPVPKGSRPQPKGRMRQEKLYDEGHSMATWSGDQKSVVKIVRQGDDVVLDHIVRGPLQPKGSSPSMLADAIRASGNPKPSKILVPNIIQKAPTSDAMLESVARGAAEELGGKVTNVTKGVDAGGKHFVNIEIGY